MPKLEVMENKKLVLKNVLKKELKSIHIEDINKEIQNFMTRVELLKAKVFGPLIIHSIGTNISEAGELTMDYELLVQVHDYMQYKNEFVVEERFVCPHCLYLHFEGNPEELTYAHSKLDLHIYENELFSNGELYTICLNESESYMSMDLFRPIQVS